MQVLLHFVIGTLVSLGLFLIFTLVLRKEAFSAPFGVIFVGIACAALAQFVSPWCTPLVLLLYTASSLHELRQEREAQSQHAAMQQEKNLQRPQ